MIKNSIETGTLYNVEYIGEKLIVIFDGHNMALPVWGKISNKIGKSGELLTFDYHTDTRDSFVNSIGGGSGHLSRLMLFMYKWEEERQRVRMRNVRWRLVVPSFLIILSIKNKKCLP